MKMVSIAVLVAILLILSGCRHKSQDSQWRPGVNDPTATVSYAAIDTIFQEAGFYFFKVRTVSPMPESLFRFVPDIQNIEMSADSGITIFKALVAIPDSVKKYRGNYQFTSTIMTGNDKKYRLFRFWKDNSTYLDTVLGPIKK
jgi:hypothetical protein